MEIWDDEHTCTGRYRLRTRIRGRLPWFLIRLGVADKGPRDCGCHEFYVEAEGVYRCYHCRVGYRTTPPWDGWPTPRVSGPEVEPRVPPR